MKETCFKGLDQSLGNSKGRCCCNCQHQVKIVGHPFNHTKTFNGSISKQISFGCSVESQERQIVVAMEQEHGLCEMHEWFEKLIPNG